MNPRFATALCVVALLPVAASAQSRLHGKSAAQVLAMGELKWMSHVADQEGGSSTAGMLDGLHFYYQAAYKRNAGRLTKQSRARQAVFKAVRAATRKAGESLLAVERTANGGGTMYSLFGPSRAIHIEETIYTCLTKRAVAGEVFPDDALLKLLDAWSRHQLAIAMDDTKGDTEKLIVIAAKDFRLAIAACAKLTPLENDAFRLLLMDWCRVEPN